MASRHEKGRYENDLHIFLVCKGLANNGVGVARGTLFHEIAPEADFKTRDIAREKSGGRGGGITVERLVPTFLMYLSFRGFGWP